MAFEQASWNTHQIYDDTDKNFKASLEKDIPFSVTEVQKNALASGKTVEQFEKN